MSAKCYSHFLLINNYNKLNLNAIIYQIFCNKPFTINPLQQKEWGENYELWENTNRTNSPKQDNIWLY